MRHDFVEGTKWQSNIGPGYHGGLFQGDTGQDVPNGVHTCTKCKLSVDLNKGDRRRQEQKLAVFRTDDDCPGNEKVEGHCCRRCLDACSEHRNPENLNV